MKSSSIRGTPIRSISANNGQGFNPSSKPAGYDGTVPVQYEGDQSQKVNPKSGTPYNSAAVNDDDQRTASSGPFGDVIDTQTGTNLNRPESNGNGVVFDGVTEANDYLPSPAGYPESPVPKGAQAPDRSSSDRLNALRSGTGKDFGPTRGIPDNFQKMGGVMSRGMVGTTGPGESEDVLTRDDVL